MTTFGYDSADRLTSTIDPAQKTTAFEYNARSQMTAVVDAFSQRYEFVYDALGRRTQEKKGTATKSFVYDAAGNPSQRTDYNGAITNYTNDALNRLTTISYPDTTSATDGYDVLSRLTTATNPTGTVTIAYDNQSRVSSVTDVFGQGVGYQYDANSNRTQLSLNSTTNATYQYDVINRLTQLTDNASLNTTFSYDATNKLTSRTLPNGVVSTHQYDGLDRLTRLTHAKGGNTLADFQYQFNAVNNITQMIDGAGTHNYSNDTLDRLTAATHPAGQPNENYTYDDVGNRTASHQGSSYTPYVTSKWPTVFSKLPKDADPLDYQVITEKNVPLRSEPNIGTSVIATLNYDVVRVHANGSVADFKNDNARWLKISTVSGQQGFIHQDIVRSPSDYQACFRKTGSRWLMTEFASRE